MRTIAANAVAAVLALLTAACAGNPAAPGSSLDAVIAGEHRTPEFAARDKYRHPKETLEFFGLEADQTVVEVWPGGGWYTEILAPYLRAQGTYYAAGYNTGEGQTSKYRLESQGKFNDKLKAKPEVYDKVIGTVLDKPDYANAAPAGSADLVLTFRNVHNWMGGGYEARMFKAFHAALKPGGVLGVVEHRAAPGTSMDDMKKSGYVTEAYVIELATGAGFELMDRSEINANPKDTRNHPEGVWTLPPSLRLGDQDREKYVAIGESDRMTLKFVKPIRVADPPKN